MTYWVQIEFPTKGHYTNAMQFDLEKVDTLEFARDGESIIEVSFRYANVTYPPLKGPSAQSFYDKWMRYLSVEEKELKEQDPPGTPSIIQAPNASLSMLQAENSRKGKK